MNGFTNNPFIIFLCIGIPTIIILIEIFKQFELYKIFNFRKELKKIRRNNYTPKIKNESNTENSTFIGVTTSKKKIYTANNAKQIFVCGTTGSGKTVVLSNYIKSAIEKNYPLFILDGKGDTNENSLLDIITKVNTTNRKLFIVDMNDPFNSSHYNPFINCNHTIAKDMLINMSEWSEEHYKLNAERYLQRVCFLLLKNDIPLSFNSITENLSVDKFISLSSLLLKNKQISKEEHILNIEISKSSGKIAESSIARFSNIIESSISNIFATDGIDIYTALKQNYIVLFILNPLMYSVLSSAVGRLALIDCKKAISNFFVNHNFERTFFIFDEINVYASKTFLDLINKSRSANVTCILATQSLSDLETTDGTIAFREQIIENCNNYIVLRQNSATNADNWASILGTKDTLDITYQLQQEAYNTKATGLGSARRVKEFLYHPNVIKNLKTGEAIFLSKDTNKHAKIFINKPF